MVERTNNRVFQAGLGTEWERTYKEGTKVTSLLLAQVIKVNYKYNTVDLMTFQEKNTFQGSHINNGKFSAKLPLEFGGRNSLGQPYGQVRPINVGDMVLVGFVEKNKIAPVVLSVYGSTDVNEMLSRTPFENADPKDETLARQTNQRFSLYPSLTYENIDGEGNQTVTFTGKTFFHTSAVDSTNSAVTDGNHGTEYSELEGSYYANGEEIEPMNPFAPNVLFKHQGVLTQEGGEDNHLTTLFIQEDGTYRVSTMDKADDWRTYFEMTPDGAVKLRKQFDSKIIGTALERSELGIDKNGTIFLRNRETSLEVKSDGIYSNGKNLDIDLSGIQGTLEEQGKTIIHMQTSITKTDKEVAIIAEATELVNGELRDLEAKFVIMADKIESTVTEARVEEIVNEEIGILVEDIEKIREDNERLSKLFADISNDGLITPLEKDTLKREWQIVQDEYPVYLIQAEEYEVSAQKYTEAYVALEAYLAVLFLNMEETTAIVPEDFRSTFKEYYDRRLELLTAILLTIKKIAVEAMRIASDASLDASNAWLEATEAREQASKVDGLIQDIASDGKLTPNEKYTLRREYNIVTQEHPTVLAQAEKYEVPTTTYEQSYLALTNYITDNQLFLVMGETSAVEGAELQAVFTTYYVEKVKLLRAVTDEAKTITDDHAGRIYLAETKITQTSEIIALLATRVETLDGRVEANSAELLVQAEMIRQRVTKTEMKQEIDNLEIGLTNALRNTALLADQSFWSEWGTSLDGSRMRVAVTGLPNLNYGFEVLKQGGGVYGYQQTGVTLLPETKYNISVWARAKTGSAVVTLRKGNGTTDSYEEISQPVGTRWNRISLTWTSGISADTTGYFVGLNEDISGAVLLAGMKMEEGEKVTSWTASPLDAKAEIQDEISKFPLGGANYVAFSSGDEQYPRLMIKNVGYYTTSGSATTFSNHQIRMTPSVAGTTGSFIIGTQDIPTARVGLENYGITATQNGDYLTVSADIRVFGGSARLLIEHLDNGTWKTFQSDPIRPLDGTKRAVALGKITQYTEGIVIRVVGEKGFTSLEFSKVQLETGMKSTAWKKSTMDLENDIDNAITTSKNQFVATLSNDSALIPTEEDGSGGDYFTAQTTLNVYQLGVDDTANWTITAVPTAGVIGTLEGARYTVTAMNTDAGYVTLTAKKGIFVLNKVFNLVKAKRGQEGPVGQDAQSLDLLVSSNVIRVNKSGVIETERIEIVADVRNATGESAITAVPYIGMVAQQPITLGGAGNNRFLLPSAWNIAWDSLVLQATLKDLRDTQTIVRIFDGADGASNYNVLILSTEGETFKNGVIQTVLQAKVYYGDKDITAELDANQFRWTRSSVDKVADMQWNNKYFGGAKEIQITTEDVNKRATFSCDILGVEE